MKKTALVILAGGFEEIEAVTAIDILRRAGVEVSVAGLQGTEIKGAHGLVIMAEDELQNLGDDFDALVLPGGTPGASRLAGSARVTSLIKTLYKKGNVIAAICAAPALVLQPTGILKNKTATCYKGMEKSFGKDTLFSTERVVIDGNLITSRGPATALDFALAVAEKLVGKTNADAVRQATLAAP